MPKILIIDDSVTVRQQVAATLVGGGYSVVAAGDAEVGGEPPSVRVVWRGRSGARSPWQILSPFFDELSTIAEERALAIEHDFRKLDHMNSSTISALIQLVQTSRTRKVPLRFVYD